jgi:hypothetical protein
MAEELLERVVCEIRERSNQARGAHEESRRLEAALAAVDRGSRDGAASKAPARRSPPAKPRSRAPRGENLRRIRAAVEERPGATAGEVAAATAIARATVASTLAKLARDGEFQLTADGYVRLSWNVDVYCPYKRLRSFEISVSTTLYYEIDGVPHIARGTSVDCPSAQRTCATSRPVFTALTGLCGSTVPIYARSTVRGTVRIGRRRVKVRRHRSVPLNVVAVAVCVP